MRDGGEIKRNWKNLWDDKCPIVGCNTGGEKTMLVREGDTVVCQKCGGEWMLVCPAPMDITWREIVKPNIDSKG